MKLLPVKPNHKKEKNVYDSHLIAILVTTQNHRNNNDNDDNNNNHINVSRHWITCFILNNRTAKILQELTQKDNGFIFLSKSEKKVAKNMK